VIWPTVTSCPHDVEGPLGSRWRSRFGLGRGIREAFIPVDPEMKLADTNGPFHVTVRRETGEQTLWRLVDGQTAMQSVGGQVELRAKEGLALNNGATFSAAIAALAVHDARNLVENAELALALSLEAARGFRDSFSLRFIKYVGMKGPCEQQQMY